MTWTPLPPLSVNLNRLPPAADFLGDLLPQIAAALDAASQPQPGCPPRLGEAMRYSLLAPGKRLRPALALMAAEACGGTVNAAMPAAVAVEMVHTYSLIHDDLPAMDDDDLRRGRPTCHVQFDEATAILAGDALLARAFEVLVEGLLAQGLPAERIAEAVRCLSRAAGPTALVGGQADDLAATESAPSTPSDPGSPVAEAACSASPGEGKGAAEDDSHRLARLEHLESIHRRKTGALFAASLDLGAIAVAANPSQRGALDYYAQALGLAFQIVDDLLDQQGSTDEVGKRTGKDLDRGKLTFPGLLGVDASRQRAEKLIDEAVQAAALFGAAGERLIGLAQFVLQRSR